MHAYRRGAWTEHYLDESPQEGQVRVSVHRQIALVPVDDEFFVRRADPAMLVSYLRSLGPRRVVRKVVSRRREAARNDTWLSVGLGTLDERLKAGDEIDEAEQALMQRALEENSVIVAEMTPFFD